MKPRFIVNARSGGAARALPAVRAYAAARGVPVVLTERCGHGAELARAALAEGCELVVAVGGDGTMNEVASALVGTSATLGLVPCGSGDGLGRCLGLHGPAEHALRVLDHGHPRRIDTGTADGHPFFTAAGLGFEAEIAQRFNQLTQRGFLRYLSTAFRLWRQWIPEPYEITHAGGTVRVSAFTLVVTNANQYGNDARIAPAARVDDGRLNLTAIPPVTLLRAIPLVVRLFAGDVTRARGVTALVGDHFIVRRPQPGWLHTDGELRTAGASVEFRVRPASLSILCPAP
ncbi:diacylglycerol kinase family protein [Opitutus sp. ER46]|uniref:diacylglycerol/lipid kinase family protein n=1 Tax=Opitutus sp. ER46 TaxID=2161864 RepID=UPI000D2FFC03|nr:diacylglycerol kinase family protein [Opitutus sp. ER46]PTY00365.1 diacylglycerol kinase [Opitutus sp. ER46]